MANTKVTKKDNFNTLRSMAQAQGRQDLVDFIDHEIELINKKNSAERKPTVNQLDNKAIKKIILENIGANRYTITEMIKALLVDTEWSEITCSRMTAICTQLVDSGELVRDVDKRKAYYKKP